MRCVASRVLAVLGLALAGCHFTINGLGAGVDQAGVDLTSAGDLAAPPGPPDLLAPADLTPALDLAQPVGALIGSFASSDGTTVNLTTQGTLDWMHFGSGTDRKLTGNLIMGYTVIGGATAMGYPSGNCTFTWLDGAPTPAGNTSSEVFVSGAPNGFSLTAPAELMQHTLKVYVDPWHVDATVRAHLSDSSAPDYTNVISAPGGDAFLVYTFVYKAASAGKTLTVSIVDTKDYGGTGNVSLEAATLQ